MIVYIPGSWQAAGNHTAGKNTQNDIPERGGGKGAAMAKLRVKGQGKEAVPLTRGLASVNPL